MTDQTDLATELEREAVLLDASEPETLAVFGEVCLNNLPAILSALRIADEARLAGWIINPDGSITRPAYGADFIAALEDGDLIIGEQRRELEAALRSEARLREALECIAGYEDMPAREWEKRFPSANTIMAPLDLPDVSDGLCEIARQALAETTP